MVTVFSKLRFRTFAIVFLFPFMTACAPVALTVFGVGAAVGVNYTLNGYAYKTFTAPVAEVRKAVRQALKRMGIEVENETHDDKGYTLTALAGDWGIEVFLEPISAKATRMRTTASQSALQKDRATAVEIVLQTENVLVGN